MRPRSWRWSGPEFGQHRVRQKETWNDGKQDSAAEALWFQPVQPPTPANLDSTEPPRFCFANIRSLTFSYTRCSKIPL